MLIAKVSENHQVEDGTKFVEYSYICQADDKDEQVFMDHIADALKQSSEMSIKACNGGFSINFVEQVEAV